MLSIDLPIAMQNALTLNEAIGAIAGTVVGIQTVLIQRYLDNNYRSWRSTIITIAFYAFAWTILFGVVTYVGISLDPQKPLMELRDAILFSLPFPFLTHLSEQLFRAKEQD